MPKSYIVIIIAVVVLVGGLIYWLNTHSRLQPQPSSQAQPFQNSSSSQPTKPTPTPAAKTPAPAAVTHVSVAPAAPTTQSFTVNANDSSADLTIIKVNKGSVVKITFNVETSGAYHGGLDFRSSVVSTGAISPGSSKTISFTAQSSFTFTPYWPATNIQKPYNINIVVR